MLDSGKAHTSFCWVLPCCNQDLSSELSSLIQSWCNQAWRMLCWEDEDFWWFLYLLSESKYLFICLNLEPPTVFQICLLFSSEQLVVPHLVAKLRVCRLKQSMRMATSVTRRGRFIVFGFMDATLSMLLVETHAVHIAWSGLKMESYIRFGFLDVNLQVANWVSLDLTVKCLSCPKPMARKASFKHSHGSNWQLYFPQTATVLRMVFQREQACSPQNSNRHDRVQHGDVKKFAWFHFVFSSKEVGLQFAFTAAWKLMKSRKLRWTFMINFLCRQWTLLNDEQKVMREVSLVLHTQCMDMLVNFRVSWNCLPDWKMGASATTGLSSSSDVLLLTSCWAMMRPCWATAAVCYNGYFPSSSSSRERNGPHTEVVIIGVNKYSSMGFPNLEGACHDAECLAEAFTEVAKMSQRKVVVTKLIDPVADEIRNTIRDVVGRLTKNSLFMLFFSGHGVCIEDHWTYTVPANPQSHHDWIPMEGFIQECIIETKVEHVRACCFFLCCRELANDEENVALTKPQMPDLGETNDYVNVYLGEAGEGFTDWCHAAQALCYLLYCGVHDLQSFIDKFVEESKYLSLGSVQVPTPNRVRQTTHIFTPALTNHWNPNFQRDIPVFSGATFQGRVIHPPAISAHRFPTHYHSIHPHSLSQPIHAHHTASTIRTQMYTKIMEDSDLYTFDAAPLLRFRINELTNKALENVVEKFFVIDYVRNLLRYICKKLEKLVERKQFEPIVSEVRFLRIHMLEDVASELGKMAEHEQALRHLPCECKIPHAVLKAISEMCPDLCRNDWDLYGGPLSDALQALNTYYSDVSVDSESKEAAKPVWVLGLVDVVLFWFFSL